MDEKRKFLKLRHDGKGVPLAKPGVDPATPSPGPLGK